MSQKILSMQVTEISKQSKGKNNFLKRFFYNKNQITNTAWKCNLNFLWFTSFDLRRLSSSDFFLFIYLFIYLFFVCVCFFFLCYVGVLRGFVLFCQEYYDDTLVWSLYINNHNLSSVVLLIQVIIGKWICRY